MSENSREGFSSPEDQYEDITEFHDVWHGIYAIRLALGLPKEPEMVNFPFEKIRKAIDQNPLAPVTEEHFIKGWREAVIGHPLKVARINQCLALINECTDKEIFARAINELYRLLHGKKKRLPFEGEEYNPDKLELE